MKVPRRKLSNRRYQIKVPHWKLLKRRVPVKGASSDVAVVGHPTGSANLALMAVIEVF